LLSFFLSIFVFFFLRLTADNPGLLFLLQKNEKSLPCQETHRTLTKTKNKEVNLNVLTIVIFFSAYVVLAITMKVTEFSVMWSVVSKVASGASSGASQT
jgi:hypothetical protein